MKFSEKEIYKFLLNNFYTLEKIIYEEYTSEGRRESLYVPREYRGDYLEIQLKEKIGKDAIEIYKNIKPYFEKFFQRELPDVKIKFYKNKKLLKLKLGLRSIKYFIPLSLLGGAVWSSINSLLNLSFDEFKKDFVRGSIFFATLLSSLFFIRLIKYKISSSYFDRSNKKIYLSKKVKLVDDLLHTISHEYAHFLYFHFGKSKTKLNYIEYEGFAEGVAKNIMKEVLGEISEVHLYFLQEAFNYLYEFSGKKGKIFSAPINFLFHREFYWDADEEEKILRLLGFATFCVLEEKYGKQIYRDILDRKTSLIELVSSEF